MLRAEYIGLHSYRSHFDVCDVLWAEMLVLLPAPTVPVHCSSRWLARNRRSAQQNETSARILDSEAAAIDLQEGLSWGHALFTTSGNPISNTSLTYIG